MDPTRTQLRMNALHTAFAAGKTPLTNPDQRQQLLDNVTDGLYEPDALEEINAFRFNLTQILLIFYREIKRRDPPAALWLLRSHLEDHPTAPGSRLYNKMMASLEASAAAQQCARDALHGRGNRAMTFLTAKEAYRAGAGFLSTLMGWLYPLYQVFEGGTPDWRALRGPDAKKLDDFTSLSKGRDGLFFMLTPLVNKHLRNAIAHGDIQLDAEGGKVLYSNVIGGNLVDGEMDVTEFLSIALYLFSRLPSVYLGVLSTILIVEFGQLEDKLKLPVFSLEKISGTNITV